ncbi:MAG: phosphonate C-P lyase system protein PhnH [Candidatus Aquicultor sp.]|nr:phosphonate C-P lyase system protein PhnH [Candidatus Aquicultor sp.]
MNLSVRGDFDPVFDAQKIFRLILDCMARPGKINYLLGIHVFAEKEDNSFYLIARTLLDNEIYFVCLDDETDSLTREISLSTGAIQAVVEQADFIFCDGRKEQADLYLAKPGTPDSPDQGATVIMYVDGLLIEKPDVGEGYATIGLSGPGIDGKKEIWIAGIHHDNLHWLALQNRDYPLGTDTILVDLEGGIMCIPRSSSVTWEVNR